jgi:hypothetical protein
VRSLIIVLCLLAARSAAAETRTEHYGTTVAIIDGAALGVVGAGAVILPENKPLGIVALSVGGAVYMLGSPIAHYLKATREKYYSSVLLRVAALAVFGGAGAKLGETRCPEDDKNCDSIAIGFAIGAGIGALASTTLDIALLAKRQVAVVPANGGAMVHVGGAF